MVHIGDHDFISLGKRLPDREADDSDERCGVHSKSNLIRTSRIHEISHALPAARDRCVHLLALGIAAASLHVALQEVTIHRIEHLLRNLGTGSVVEKDEGRRVF